MPAEWEPQLATWLAWPHQQEDWPDKFAAIPLVYTEIIRHITRVQQVKLIVRNQAMEERALELLGRAHVKLDRVSCYQLPTNRAWLRDSGPIFVKQGRRKLALDWHFNAWAKYDNWRHDDRVPARVAALDGVPTEQPRNGRQRIVLEGGAIDVNGAGALLTTEECLLSRDVQCRNPGASREDYQRWFARYLGIDQVIWLHKGIVGDDTHGHVDDITRFTGTHTVITAVENNRRDANHKLLAENLARLRKVRIQGRALEVVELPMPKPLLFEDLRLPASYANFLICNGLVLVPTFNDVNDRVALSILEACFPGREVVGIHAVDLVWGLGTLHCMSQQEPR